MSYNQFAYYYDRLMRDMPYGKWLTFTEDCWERYGKPATVVDLGCGTGMITIPIAQNGTRVIGIDLSEDMLAVASSKSDAMEAEGRSAKTGSITWLHQDIREWQLTEKVDVAISFCDCFNYLLAEEDIIQAFRQTYEGLSAGGLFIFDVHTPQQLASYAATQPFFLDEEDAAYIWTCNFDKDTCQIEHELTIFVQELPRSQTQQLPKFLRIEETHTQRAYPINWLKQQLQKIGFNTVDCYADFTWEPTNEATERAFLVCHKAAGPLRI